MCIKSNEMSQHEKDEIFGVKEVPEFSTNGLELRYEVEHGQEGEHNYLRQRVYRDKVGKYFLDVRAAKDEMVRLSIETSYPSCGQDALIPVRPEALAIWARFNLENPKDRVRAQEEFKSPKDYSLKIIWRYQQDTETSRDSSVHESLWRADGADGGFYILCSTTDDVYPCPGCNVPFVDLDGTCRDDLYMYFVTPETARRWAEARGMAEADCQMAFEH